MKSSNLKDYPNLQNILSSSLSELFKKNFLSPNYASTVNCAERVYASFIDLSTLGVKADAYCALDILNDVNKLNQQYRCLVGFLYSCFSDSYLSKYKFTLVIDKFYANLAAQAQSEFCPVEVSKSEISVGVDACIRDFQMMDKSAERLSYYSGWTVKNKTGGQHQLSLTQVYDQYGSEFVGKLHLATENWSFRESKRTLSSLLVLLHRLLNSFVSLMPTYSDFTQRMSLDNSYSTMALVYNFQLLQAKQKKQNLKSFHDKWRISVGLFYDIFVLGNLIDEPLIPILVPKFKSSLSKVKDTSGEGALSETTTVSLTPIPLSYSDSKAKEAIFDNIQRDLDHVVICAERSVEQTMQCLRRGQFLSLLGKVKFPEETSLILNEKGGVAGSTNPNPVGIGNTSNVVATFHHFLFDKPVGNYASFLGFQGQNPLLTRLLCLPTQAVLYPFLVLLINEHPLITPSWLETWQLYDEQGRKVGYKQSKDQWIAVSYKARKGTNKAQQVVVLNERSKYLVDCIVELTSLCRTYMRRKNMDGYRYMLLIANSVGTMPKRVSKIINPHNNGNQLKAFCAPTFKQGKFHLSEQDAAQLSSNITLRKVRESKSICVYFQTQSVHAMSEALGHARYQPGLLERYLPKPLWDYFINRWIRQFQNAIVYEAMKGSDMVFDCIDVREEELADFIENHGLKDLPTHIHDGKRMAQDLSNDEILNGRDESVYTVSVGLFQVFFAIVSIVETCGESDCLTSTAQKWLESAYFVLNHIELNFCVEKKVSGVGKMLLDTDVVDMYELAKANPLNLESIKGAVLC